MSIWDAFAKISSSNLNSGGEKPEFIIAGLGNFGIDYENTRHNAGFIVMDKLAEINNIKLDRHKFKSVCGFGKIADKSCLILKPQTYMNNSGEAIAEACNFYKIPVENIIVVFDDISLDVGKMRIRRKGSHGGHNGAKSIEYLLNSQNYPRIKIGVGQKPHKDYDLAKWVLSRFTDDELKTLDTTAKNACDAISIMISDDISKAMNLYN